MTPDPYVASAKSASDPKTPQSWDRYAYVMNDPINHRDRQGLCTEDLNGDFWDDATEYWQTDEQYYSPGSCYGDPTFDALYTTVGAVLNGAFVSAAPSMPAAPPPQPKCWQNTGNISATLSNLGTDIEADVEGGPNGKFSASDLQLLTADINSDIASEMAAIGGGTTASPYYIGGHFNLTISANQIAAFSPSDRQTFASDFWGGTRDGVRQAASTGLAAAGGYALHSHGGVNAPYSFHFDRFNPQDLAGLVGHGVYDVVGGHLGHPCLDPAWQ